MSLIRVAKVRGEDVDVIDQNELSRLVTLNEGLKVSCNIGQVKEVQRLLLEELSRLPVYVVLNTLKMIREG